MHCFGLLPRVEVEQPSSCRSTGTGARRSYLQRSAFAVVSMSGIPSRSISGPFGLGIPRRMGFDMFEFVGTRIFHFIVSILVVANTCVILLKLRLSWIHVVMCST